MEKHIYSMYEEKWQRALDRIIPIQSPLSQRIEKDAIVLPLRKRTDTECINGAFEGGVTDKNGSFIAGIQRNRFNCNTNFACCRGYKVDAARRRPERAVFGGVLYGHWGHVILDSCTRLWHYARNSNDGLKRVFVTTPNTDFKHGKLFDAAGMNWEIIKEPTIFDELIIPDEAFFTNDSGNPIWLEWWDFLRNKYKSNTGLPKRVYLTRTNFPSQDGVNESYYEKYFANKRYYSLSPEMLPLDTQIRRISAAESIICTMGTISHMLVFAKPGIDVTILLRHPSSIMTAQLTINLLKKFNWQIVDAARNPLPTSQSNGTFLYASTEQFREWAVDMGYGLPKPIEPCSDDIRIYLKKWLDNYKTKLSWRYIKDRTAIDFLDALNVYFYKEHLDKSQY